jgi:hypothetical protein
VHFQLLNEEWPDEVQDKVWTMLQRGPLNEVLTLSSSGKWINPIPLSPESGRKDQKSRFLAKPLYPAPNRRLMRRLPYIIEPKCASPGEQMRVQEMINMTYSNHQDPHQSQGMLLA